MYRQEKECTKTKYKYIARYKFDSNLDTNQSV